MDKWIKLVTEFHTADHPESPESLVIGAPATEEEIAALESETGFKFPAEFHEFYRSCNGFGRKDGEEVIWFCAPLEEILKMSGEARKWFRGTHEELAEQFVAFIDWESGDYTGYVFDEDGEPFEALFDFEHESYDYESRQDPDEFLVPIFPSIEDFLSP